MERTKKDLLSEEEVDQEVRRSGGQCDIKAGGSPTCGHGADQHRAELDDGAEDVFGVRRACQVLTVTLEDETLVLFLEQDQDVFKEEGVQL